VLSHELFEAIVEQISFHFAQGDTHRCYSTDRLLGLLSGFLKAYTAMGVCARAKRRQLWERDGPYCQICGRTFESFWDKELTLDHIHPQFLGGGHDLSNLRLACGRCNLDYAKEFRALIELKKELVRKERRQPGTKPNQKYVLVVSPTSKEATFLVPKGARTFIRELIRRMPLIRPCANSNPVHAVATAAAPSPFALSPNVNHGANHHGGGTLPPWAVPVSLTPAHRASGGSTCTWEPTHSPPPPDDMLLDLSDL
jgi:HNH endonuclease